MHPSLMIEARGLTKRFGPATALRGLDLQVPAGTTTCLLGPNGAGKTTVLRILTTLLRPDGGCARVAGRDVVADGAAVRRRIGLSGQHASVDECMTGRANLVMIGELSRLPRRAARQRAAELLAAFELEFAAGRAVRTYSGGMRRKLDLAASLVTRPAVLFLDEPTTGLDPRSRQALWDVIRDRVSHGTTVLLTTQYLDEADRLADRICVMDGGRVTAEGTAAQLKAEVGTARLVMSLAAGTPVGRAMEIAATHAAGPVTRLAGPGQLEFPVVPRPGLVTGLVAGLSAAGIAVDGITVQEPSLDDVYHALTGGPAGGVPGGPAERVPSGQAGSVPHRPAAGRTDASGRAA